MALLIYITGAPEPLAALSSTTDPGGNLREVL